MMAFTRRPVGFPPHKALYHQAVYVDKSTKLYITYLYGKNRLNHYEYTGIAVIDLYKIKLGGNDE